VEGGGTGTGISAGGLLTVAANEPAESLKVVATSTVDDSKSGIAIVTLTGGESPVPTVNAVSVNPDTPTIARGETQQFTAEVTGTNNPAQTVTWDVQGGETGTAISEEGLLTVAANEPAESLKVVATSTVDNSKSGIAYVTVTDTTAPAEVSELTGTAGDGQVTLNWTDPPDEDLAFIEISWNGGSTTAPTSNEEDRANSATITGLMNRTPYTFTLKTVDNAASANKSLGTASEVLTPLSPPAGFISVRFTGLPQDETITLSGADTPLSWAANTPLTVSVGEDFVVNRWELDGEALAGETGQTITLNARNLAVNRHTLTVFVTKSAGESAVRYTKSLTFTVTQ
jgi:hypothetical protein